MIPVPFLHLAAYLEKHAKYNIAIRDCRAEKKGWEDVAGVIMEENPDVICLTGFTPDCYNVYRGAFIAKNVSPHIKTIAGGQHFTWTSEQSLKECPWLDYIVRREGESSLLELLRAIEGGKDKEKDTVFMRDIKGIAFLSGGTYIQPPDMPYIEDINSLPMPAYHLVDMDRYSVNYVKHKRAAVIFGSRGCMANCEFCTTPWHWGSWRPRSAQLLVDEAELMVKKYHRDSIWFIDDCFNISRERIIAFCEEVFKRDLKIGFWIHSRADLVVRDEDLFPLLKRAGLGAVLMGVESPFDSRLKEYKKGTDTEMNIRAAGIIKKSGMALQTCFMFGHPYDNAETADELLKFARKLDYDFLTAMMLTPFPGTVFYEKLKSQGRILSDNWRHYAFEYPIIKNETCSPKELAGIHWNINFKAYVNIAHTAKMLLRIPKNKKTGNWAWNFYWETFKLFFSDFLWGLLRFKVPQTAEDFTTVRLIKKRYIPALGKDDWEKIRIAVDAGEETKSIGLAADSYLAWDKDDNSKYHRYKKWLVNDNRKRRSRNEVLRPH